MNEQIKQRLVGAVVLISLAVIFIPMLLDGGNNSSMPTFGSNIPDQPDFNFEPLEIPLDPVEPLPEERPRHVEKVEEPAAPVAEKPATAKAEQEKTAPSVVESKPAAKGEPLRWVVQVGSFGQSANALMLREKLRKNGFNAFVEKYLDEGKTSYRVRVGPELKRETSEKQREELQRKLKIKGIVMGHR